MISHIYEYERLALACAGLFLATAVQGAPLFRCPGNLFTNQIDPVQARAEGCREADAQGLTQAVVGTAAQPVAAAPQQPVERAVSSTAQSTTRHQRAASAQAPDRRPVASPEQRARDSDARAILQTELARTLAAQQAMTGARAGTPDPAALQRLRADEAALRRELKRLTP